MLQLFLLGTPLISIDDTPVKLTRRRSRALLYYIAEHTQPITREHVLSVFWPHLERSAAQQSLRTTLHGLRKTLDAWLDISDNTLALTPGVLVDTRLQKVHLNPPSADLTALQTALDFYRGDFLMGVTLSDAPDFDDWQITQSEHYRRLTLRGWATLSERYAEAGDFAAALDAIERALALDDLQEDLQQAALRVHYWAGDRAGAIRRYERLRQMLADEMGVPPMRETRDLYDAILNDTLAPAPAPVLSPAVPRAAPQLTRQDALPFAGRTAELAALREFFDATPHQLAVIEGEPGIGKTRLAHEFIATTYALPLIGRAHELEHTLPYHPVIEMLRRLLAQPDWSTRFQTISAALPPVWLTETARLIPELLPQSPAAQPPDEARLWEGISQFLLALADQHPLVMLLDDLQWADASTLGLLSYLVRNTASSRLTYIATLRTHEASFPSLATLLQALTRTDQLRRFPLSRLDHAAIDAIAQQFSATYAYPLSEWLSRSSEGNPYILAELLRHLRAEHILLDDGQLDLNWLSASPVVPQTVYSLIEARLAQLSDDARRILDTAVTIGREFEFDVVFRAADLAESATLDALEQLVSLGLVQPHNKTSYVFDHNLTMEVAYREAGEVRHRLFHRRLAETLAGLHHDNDDEAGLIASHFIEGNAPERAAPYMLRAAHHATRLAAWSEAITFYEQAYNLEQDDRQRITILMAIGNAHFRAGHAAQASDAYRAALQLAETLDHVPQVCDARLGLAESMMPQARYHEAVALVEHYPSPHDFASALFAVRAELTMGTALSLEGANLDTAVHHLQQGMRLLNNYTHDDDVVIDPLYAAHLQFELGSIAAQQGELEQAITLYRYALADAERSQHPAAVMRSVLAYNNLAYHLHLLDDPGAQEYATAGLARAEEAGMLSLQPYLYSTSGEILLAQGDLDAADAHFQKGLALAQQFTNLERIAGLTANRGLVALAQDNLPLAIHYFSSALARADAVGTQHLAARIRLWLAPLLPLEETRLHLNEARAIALQGGRKQLLDEIARLERDLFNT